MSAPQAFLTIKQVAEKLQVDRRTVQRYVQAGKLRVYRISTKNVRVDASEFQRFLNMRRA